VDKRVLDYPDVTYTHINWDTRIITFSSTHRLGVPMTGRELAGVRPLRDLIIDAGNDGYYAYTDTRKKRAHSDGTFSYDGRMSSMESLKDALNLPPNPTEDQIDRFIMASILHSCDEPPTVAWVETMPTVSPEIIRSKLR
jgi:hypothetical protein